MSSFFDESSLVFIPSGYKTSKAYSVKPTDGTGDLTFTRSNDTATRVASNGLIEKVRTNLCLQSQTIDNATSWSNTLDTGATISVTANYAAAPDGTTTAERIQMALNGSTYAQRNQSVTLAAGGEFTYSVYLKSLSGTPTIIFFYDNVNNKTATLTSDWVRYTWTFTSTGNVLPRFVLEATTSSSADILAWGCQLETGVATPYIATTTAAVSVGPVANVPRLDYLNSSCPRLLLEPQRSSLVTFSESFNNAAWTKLQTSVTANSIVSPDGFTNADTLTADGTSNEHQLRSTGVVTLTSGTTYTTSIFAKAGTNNFVQFIGSGSIYSATTYANFNIATGVVGDVGAGTTASIVAYGNGWYRCSMTALANATDSTNTFLFNIVTSNTAVRGESNTLSTNVYLYGAQLEAGAYATSYIPTLGASVTRGADVYNKTSVSSLIGQSEGTLFVDFTINGFGSPYASAVSVNDGVGNNYVWLTIFSNGNLRAEVWNGTVQSQIIYSGAVVGGRYKMAFGYKTNDFVLYVNGTQVGTDTSGTTFSGTTLSRIDNNLAGVASNETSQSTSQALLFKTRLTNAQLAELTTI